MVSFSTTPAPGARTAREIRAILAACLGCDPANLFLYRPAQSALNSASPTLLEEAAHAVASTGSPNFVHISFGTSASREREETLLRVASQFNAKVYVITAKSKFSDIVDQLQAVTTAQACLVVDALPEFATHRFAWEDLVHSAQHRGWKTIVDGRGAVGHVELNLDAARPDVFVCDTPWTSLSDHRGTCHGVYIDSGLHQAFLATSQLIGRRPLVTLGSETSGLRFLHASADSAAEFIAQSKVAAEKCSQHLQTQLHVPEFSWHADHGNRRTGQFALVCPGQPKFVDGVFGKAAFAKHMQRKLRGVHVELLHGTVVLSFRQGHRPFDAGVLEEQIKAAVASWKRHKGPARRLRRQLRHFGVLLSPKHVWYDMARLGSQLRH